MSDELYYSDSDSPAELTVGEDNTDPTKIKHGDLINRNAPNQHNISAIEGLDEALMNASRIKSGILTDGTNSWNILTKQLNLPGYAAKTAAVTELGDFEGDFSHVGTESGLPDVAISVCNINPLYSTMEGGFPFGTYAFHLITVRFGNKYYQEAFNTSGSSSRILGYPNVTWTHNATYNQIQSNLPSYKGSYQGNYKTAQWAAGTCDSSLNVTLPAGEYMVWVQFELINVTSAAMSAYLQVQLRGGTLHGLSHALYYDSDSQNASNRVSRTVCTPLTIATDNTTIYPYLHTNVANVDYTIRMVVMRLSTYNG